MSTALALRQPSQGDWAMIQAIASSIFESRSFNVMKAQEAEIKLLTAWENGLPLTSALQAVYIINQVPALSPKAVWAKVISHPDFEAYQEERLEKAGKFFGWRITLKRKNGVQVARAFTLEDAERAGLAKKDNWKSYPENMCYWRAMGFVEDIVFPDITFGMNRADELGAAVTQDGSVVEGSWVVQEPAQEEDPEFMESSPRDLQGMLQQLLDEYGPGAVVKANNGKIPATLQEAIAAGVVLTGVSQANQ